MLLNLEPLHDFAYDLMYYHKAQGFIYNLLRGTPFERLHDSFGYKFFCFSNFFPFSEKFEQGSKKHFLISSPNNAFIETLLEKLSAFKDKQIPLNVGEMSFAVRSIKTLSPKLPKRCKLLAVTPIIIRIPERNYEKYNIPLEERKKRYVFWRPKYDFSAFIKQLEENILKKYSEFYNRKPPAEPIFELFEYRKPVVSHVIINGKEQLFVGSLWNFTFSHLTKTQKNILQFAIECGLGERNSLGFGFVNIAKRKSKVKANG